MSFYHYLHPPNPNLVCCICRTPFTTPYTTRNCSHTFCRECILRSLEHSAQCPIDRTPLKAVELNPADPIIRSLVDELLVECSNKSLGCTHICQRQLLDVHLETTCPYAQVPCPDGKCEQALLRKNVANHRCSQGLVSCDDCGMDVKSVDLDLHRTECIAKTFICKDCDSEFPYSVKSSHSTSCAETTMPCTHHDNGCTWEGKRASLSSHILTCPYEAIKGFFALHETRRAALVDENMILKQRINTLENIIHDFTVDLQNIKVALGPWYRNLKSQSVNFQESSQLPLALQPLSASSSEISHSINSPTSPASPSPPVDQSFDYLAPFFPAEEHPSVSTPGQIPPRPEVPGTRRMRALSNLSGQGWETMNYSRTAAQNFVAPLNLNASLEGTLEGLRESVVSLSALLDSLGRRNDIALTNETLRLNEELMLLRANMHGLRMQVHTIMMDRNAQVTGRGPDILPAEVPWVAAGRFHSAQNPVPTSITKL